MSCYFCLRASFLSRLGPGWCQPRPVTPRLRLRAASCPCRLANSLSGVWPYIHPSIHPFSLSLSLSFCCFPCPFPPHSSFSLQRKKGTKSGEREGKRETKGPLVGWAVGWLVPAGADQWSVGRGRRGRTTQRRQTKIRELGLGLGLGWCCFSRQKEQSGQTPLRKDEGRWSPADPKRGKKVAQLAKTKAPARNHVSSASVLLFFYAMAIPDLKLQP